MRRWKLLKIGVKKDEIREERLRRCLMMFEVRKKEEMMGKSKMRI